MEEEEKKKMRRREEKEEKEKEEENRRRERKLDKKIRERLSRLLTVSLSHSISQIKRRIG